MATGLSSAVWTIARHELRSGWRDGRVRGAALITFILLIAATLSGWSYQQRLTHERLVAQDTEQSRWLSQDDKNPHSAAHYGIYAFKPTSALTAIDRGIDPFVGVSVWLEAHKMNPFVHRPAQDGTPLTRFGELTAALIAQVLLPLLIILLAFGIFAAERERGTLRQLLSLGVPAHSLTYGKLLGLGTILALVIGPALLLAVFAILLHTADEAARTGTRFALLALVYLAYLVGWALVALSVSARSRTSRGALVTLLAFWVLGCLAVPRAAADIAAWMHPAPSTAEFQAALERDKSPSHSAERAQKRKERLLKQYGVSRTEDLPIDWRGISLQEEEELNYPIFDRHFSALFDTYRSQDAVLQAAGLLAPLLAAQSLSHALTGTDFEHHRRFVFAAEGQRRIMQKILNDDVTLHDREGTDYRAGRELWKQIPPFNPTPPAPGEILSHYTLAIVALLVWLTATSIVALRSVRSLLP